MRAPADGAPDDVDDRPPRFATNIFRNIVQAVGDEPLGENSRGFRFESSRFQSSRVLEFRVLEFVVPCSWLVRRMVRSFGSCWIPIAGCHRTYGNAISAAGRGLDAVRRIGIGSWSSPVAAWTVNRRPSQPSNRAHTADDLEHGVHERAVMKKRGPV